MAKKTASPEAPNADAIVSLLELYRKEIARAVDRYKKKPVLSDLAQFYARFYLDLKRLEKQVDSINALKVYMAEGLLPKIMEANEINSVNLTMGYRVTGRTMMFVSMKDRDKAHKWLTENGHGDLIIPTVNAQTLAALGRELADEGIDLPEALFNVNFKDNTTVSKIPERKKQE